ncbi:uncharacterized protein [Ptychodera flava]|uniref:uncharacterized protein isoform X2 n=1 Tax=Ptychodera flava TaxID=63121 RepID=UPI00396A0661
MDAKPAFQRLSSGALKMGHSEEARKMTRTEGPYTCKTAGAVRKQAVNEIRRGGGDWQDELVVLGQHRLQFGMFTGQTFRWMLENCLGYSGWLVDGLRNERPTSTPLSDNKFNFKKYVESFDEGRHAVKLKKRERISKRQNTTRIMQSDSQASTSTRSVPVSPQVLSNPQSTSGNVICIKIEEEEMPAMVEENEASVSQEPNTDVDMTNIDRPPSPTVVQGNEPSVSAVTMSPASENGAGVVTSTDEQGNLPSVPDVPMSPASEAGAAVVTTTDEQGNLPSVPDVRMSPASEASATGVTTTDVQNDVPSVSAVPMSPASEAGAAVVTTTDVQSNVPSVSTVTTGMTPVSEASAMDVTTTDVQNDIPSVPAVTMSPASDAGAAVVTATDVQSDEPSVPAETMSPASEDSDADVTTTGVQSDVPSAPSVTMSPASETIATGVTTTGLSETLSSHMTDIVLPDGWKQTLPKADHLWISKALFQTSNNGQVEPDWSRIDQLWWYPPHPSVKRSQLPRPDEYYAQRLLLWMPRQLLQARLLCPQPTCQCELTSLGIYPYVRQVLDVDGFYNLAAEHLECQSCTNKVISWSDAVIKQLDVGHRLQFPVFLSTRNACNNHVVRLLRQSGTGNSVSQVQRKIQELHSDAWQKKTVRYLADCQGFVDSHVNGLTTKPTFEDPPIMAPIPTHHWFELIYCNDVIQRLDEIKASVTSVFGRVLKLHSTKKIARKLSGHVAGTAVSTTSVGNEHGQVLVSVLAAAKGGGGLHPMINGIVQRYSRANKPPPDLLYVDKNCCDIRKRLEMMFPGWPDLKIRLDISHFMRPFAAACTSDSHQLYDTFMQQLSSCIFEWSSEDLDRLKAATWAQMVLEKGVNPSDQDVMQRITKKELSIHCRRKTRGVADITIRIYHVLQTFDGKQGLDIMGVPLLDKRCIWNVWETQKKHIDCIQDPPNFQLYLKTGELCKDGMMLPIYQCVRGCTSVESFHDCLNQFIPATTATDLQFQTYLLGGLVRWNGDRVVTPASGQVPEPCSADGIDGYAVNKLSHSVLGKEVNKSYRKPQNYTGELIGVEYLYNQTGAVLRYYTIDPDTADAIKHKPIDGDEKEEAEDGLQEGDTVEDATVCLEELPLHEASNAVSPASLQPAEPMDTNEDDFIFTVQDTQEVREKIKLPVVPRAAETSAPMEISTPIETSASTETSTPMETSARTETIPDTTNKTSCPPDEFVKPDDIPGYEQVEDLAEFLVQLDSVHQPLSDEQAAWLIQLWKKLDECDRNSTCFSPHYRTEQTQSRSKEVSNTAADVGTNKRWSLRLTRTVEWPDCNRYVECLTAKLCERYPSTKEIDGTTHPKFPLVYKAYKHIQGLVLDNAAVMKETSIQLSEINQTTISQWYNKTPRCLEPDMFKKGVSLLTSVPSMSVALNDGRAKPLSLSAAAAMQPVIWNLSVPANTASKESTASQANAKNVVIVSQQKPGATTSLSQVASTSNKPIYVLLPPSVTHCVFSTVRALPSVRVYCQPSSGASGQPVAQIHQSSLPESASVRWHKIVKFDKESARVWKTVCQECHQPTNVNHRQYYGNYYCPNTMKMPYDEWKQQFVDRGDNKRKKFDDQGYFI